jgi:FtsH-binding integral membrane protein
VDNQILIANASDVEKASFYRKTYLHVALAILAFIVVETILLNVVPLEVIGWMMGGNFVWLFIIGLFWLGSVLADRLVFDPSREKQYLGLAVYVLLEAVIFLPMITIAWLYTGGGDMILQAAGITLAMFGGLTAVVFITKADFSFLRTILVIGGAVALGVIVMGAIFGWNLGLWFSTGMVILATTSILYQTHQLRNDYATDQYVGAALKLFASVMLLFWYILRILMSRK